MDHHDLTPLQVEVLEALDMPNTRLRWHANDHPNGGLAGRGLVMGLGGEYRGRHFTGGPIASYTTRQFVKLGLVSPIDARNARPFREGAPPYRDYALTNAGREAIDQ